MIEVCIQVAAGSREKHRYDEKTLELKETVRVSRPYPYPYGFILETSSEDGDNLDCYLITDERLEPGALVECEPLGLLEQREGRELDHKILAALPGQEVQVGQRLQQELQDFIYAVFAEYPEVEVNVGPLLPKEAALQHIRASRQNHPSSH